VRYQISLALAHRTNFPYAVLTVNVIASAVGGVVLGLAYRGAIPSEWRLILLTGVCGGLSTFSTWSVETIQLVRVGRWRSALGSVTLNLGVSLVLVTGGFLIGRLA